MSKGSKILIPFVIILLPVAFWLLLTRGHNKFETLPVIGPFEVMANGDTVYHTIPSFSFINQEGKTITDKDLDGKVYVASFFFATCPTICPKMNEQLGRVQAGTKDIKDFMIVSHTVNPERDTVEALAAYAEKMHADNNRWWFLTGNKEAIYDIARDGYLVAAAEGKDENDFFHSQDLILIDKDKRIRGLYDGTVPAEVDTLIDEIKLLMVEYRGEDR